MQYQWTGCMYLHTHLHPGGGFFLACKDLGKCSTIHSPPALFFFFFLKCRLARTHLFRCLGQDQSTVAQRAETTVSECSSTSCLWARFLIGSHTMPAQRHSQPTPTSLGHGVCMFRCNLPPALWVEWPGSFTCHCGNTRVEWTPIKSQHTKLTPEKKILPPFLPGFELATFRSRVRRSNQQAIPAPSRSTYTQTYRHKCRLRCNSTRTSAHTLFIRLTIRLCTFT